MAPVTDVIIVRGRKFRLTLQAGRVLRALKSVSDQELIPEVRIGEACKDLVRGRVPQRMRPDVVKAAFDCANYDKFARPHTGPKVLDFEQDEGYIHAAFAQAYGIDLDVELDRMHWRKFVALVHGLPDNTRIAQIMEIRARPMPKPTRYNAEERRQLAKLKMEYALRGQTSEDVADGLRTLAGALAAQAKGR